MNIHIVAAGSLYVPGFTCVLFLCVFCKLSKSFQYKLGKKKSEAVSKIFFS